MGVGTSHGLSGTEHRSVTILGSTGSVGANTVELVVHGGDRYSVEALTAFRNVARLAEQAKQVRAKLAVIADPTAYQELKSLLSGTGIEVAAGAAAVAEASSRPSDWVMAAIVGAAGLEPTLAAIRRGAIVGFANKECLVCAGQLMMTEVARHGATLVPVDSEHSAVFQVFEFENAGKVERIILTASGGPFRNASLQEMERATPAQAIAHPNWDMGAKISVDSATMMNKGLELIEAYHLFPVDNDQIEVIVHPQSIIHSMVCYADGSVLAQLGTPDMRTPIAYALSWPERMTVPSVRLNLTEIATLTFEAPNEQRFPAMRLAREAMLAGGSAPVVLNAANEVAVASFLEGAIGFLDIPAVVESALACSPVLPLTAIADVMAVDAEARMTARAIVQQATARKNYCA